MDSNFHFMWLEEASTLCNPVAMIPLCVMSYVSVGKSIWIYVSISVMGPYLNAYCNIEKTTFEYKLCLLFSMTSNPIKEMSHVANYKHIISVWDNMDDSKKTLQSLRSRLFKKDARNKGCQEEDGVNAAFFAKKQEMPSQQSTYPQSSTACLPSQPPAQHSFGRGRGFRRRNCNYCGGKNHWERQCWTKKDHIENGIPNGSQLLQAQFAQFKPQRQS
ncbi:putative Copia protein (Gag-int-pol protein), partial [Daphnia magna]